MWYARVYVRKADSKLTVILLDNAKLVVVKTNVFDQSMIYPSDVDIV